MIMRGLCKTEKYWNWCFSPCGPLKMVKLYRFYLLILEKMASNYVAAYILMKSSVKLEESHMVAI